MGRGKQFLKPINDGSTLLVRNTMLTSISLSSTHNSILFRKKVELHSPLALAYVQILKGK
jgi:hypothetical protein